MTSDASKKLDNITGDGNSQNQAPACAVYKGKLKPDTYLYIEQADEFKRVPESLLLMMGELTHIIDIDFAKISKLANAPIDEVRASISSRGFYLQMPVDDSTEEDWFS